MITDSAKKSAASGFQMPRKITDRIAKRSVMLLVRSEKRFAWIAASRIQRML